MPLITTPNLAAPDAVFARLRALSADLSDAESLKVQARLILLLVNHIGDQAVIDEATALARAVAG